MAEKYLMCPDCGAENPATAWFCQICNRDLGPTHVEMADQAQVPVPPKRKKTIILVIVVAIVVVSIVAATLAYYYQPVRGKMVASPTTVGVGSSVSFNFIPSQGVGPYGYSWSFDDGSHSAQKNPTHIYNAVGAYHVAVTVTDRAGMKGHWTTTITVRSALVFIDSVSYPSAYSNPLGTTQVRLFVDGAQVYSGVTIVPGTNHSVEVQIIWVTDYGMGIVNSMTIVDDKGSITAPTTQVDLHCVLNYSSYFGGPKFTLTAA